MSHFFLHIFTFFQSRKIFLWLLLCVFIGSLVFSASRISFVEDISSFFPNNADSKRTYEAFQKVGAANKIIVTFSQNDKNHNIDEDLLTDAAICFAEILMENDTLGYIKELIYMVDNDMIQNVSNFITHNLPYFLEEEDYQRIYTLIQPHNIENQLRIDKELLLSPMGGFVRSVVLNDPLHFSQNVLKNLENFNEGHNYNTDNGFIFNDQGECIVTITSNYPVSETANNKLLTHDIYRAANQTMDAFNQEVNIVPFGAAFISITNAQQIKHDAIFSVSIALILILALLFYFYRDVKSLFFISLSVIFGALFSLGVIVLFKSTVSIVALGISSIIFGIAINYPLHFLAYFAHTPNIKQTIKVIVNPLLIGNITTVGAFLSLLFISSDAMKDLGLFSSFLLLGTIGFVLVFLPQWVGENRLKAESGKRKGGEGETMLQFGKLAAFSPEKNRFIVLIFIVFTIVLFIFSFGTKFETNLNAINYMTQEQREEINKLIAQSANRRTLYVVAEGETVDEALEHHYHFWKGTHEGAGIGHFFPPKDVQKQKIARWNTFWNNKRDSFQTDFHEICIRQGFNSFVFDNFITTMYQEFQPQEFEFFTPIYHHLGDNYISISDNKALIYTIINGDVEQVQQVEAQLINADPSVFAFDDSSMAAKMVNALSHDFDHVLYICGFIVFAFLLFSFRRIELAILTFIPLTVAWIWILGLMNVFDMRFNIVNIILATFIFGQGDDYTILVTEGLIYEYAYGKKMLAKFKNSIILSATILFIAIGMLIFAKHPALRSLAEVAIVGMVSVVVCAYLFPPLIYRFITTKKGKPREVPWTVTRFLQMAYSFGIFMMGSFLTTISGFVLLGFRKRPGEKNRLRYHRLLQWAANFAIRGIPLVKFRYLNISGETFDKPAVIISNHQSHLDLMCLMKLTPKLVVLTNDWVWNNFFYGRLIRYADFYTVTNGIESILPQLSDAVQRGYSIVVFPEGTRSMDGAIGRFHHGAFYLAQRLGLDIVPVFLHGVGHVLPKNDFLVRDGCITMQVQARISLNDSRFTKDNVLHAKLVCQYYRQTFAQICKEIETMDYYKSFVLHNYMYKGSEVWRGVKKEWESKEAEGIKAAGGNAGSVVIENSGYGVFSFLYALSHKEIEVIAVEEDEDKVAIAKNCAGIPKNLSIYHTSEWANISSS